MSLKPCTADKISDDWNPWIFFGRSLEECPETDPQYIILSPFCVQMHHYDVIHIINNDTLHKIKKCTVPVLTKCHYHHWKNSTADRSGRSKQVLTEGYCLLSPSAY